MQAYKWWWARMASQVTLHIGTTKTGSTSIQKFLADNRGLLLEKGVFYSRALGDISHNKIPAYLHGRFQKSQMQRKHGIHNERDYRAFEQQLGCAFAAELKEISTEHIVISSEHLHSRCTTSEKFARLKELLAPVLKEREVRILVYLRPQIHHAIALYSTMLRHGLDEDINSFLKQRMQKGAKRSYFNFKKVLGMWSREFGEDALSVRPFSEVKAMPHGVLSDFGTHIGMDLTDPRLQFPERENSSMGSWAAEVLRLLNSEDEDIHLTPQARKVLRRWLREEVPPGKVRPNLEMARAFQESFASSNEWVTARYFADCPEALEVDWSAFDISTQQPEVTPRTLLRLAEELTALSER